MKNTRNAPSKMPGAGLVLPFGPKIAFSPPDELGGGDDLKAKAAAEEAAAALAAEKAAAAAAEEAAAAQAAEEARRKEAEEAARKEREEQEKGLSAKERELLHEVMEKKDKIKNAESRIDELQKQVKKFEGIDLDRVQDLIKAEKEREEKELEARGEFDRLRERMNQEREAERTAHESELQKLRDELKAANENIDELTVGQTFTQSSYIADELVLTPTKARALYGAHFDKVDGKLVGYDKPRGAKERTALIDASGNALSFDAAMAKIIDADPERDSLIRAKMKPGASSRSQDGTKSQQENEANAGKLFGASRIAAGMKAGK